MARRQTTTTTRRTVRAAVQRLLLRPNAAEHVSGFPQLEPGAAPITGCDAVSFGAPMDRHDLPVTMFRGDLAPPIAPIPPPAITTDAPPTLILTHYARARHGEGLWGTRPLIPEGESRAGR